jgi:hypothetical protein
MFTGVAMRKILLSSLILLLFFTYTNYAQQTTLSTGKAPFNKAYNHINYRTSPLASVAYANDNYTGTNLSIPIPDGTPFTNLGSFTAPNFASSMCKGGDGNYYLVDETPALYLFDPETGMCTLIGLITMPGDTPIGISYNPSNDTYYMTGLYGFYSFDINSLTATLIGYFQLDLRYIIDLCFDENGICFAYEVNITPGAAQAYIIDITDGSLTPLGYVGFTPNFGQGMSYDFETGTIYLSAFNIDTYSGQLRTMNKTTGMTTLVYDWGDQIAPFALNTQYFSPCGVQAAGNPNPPSGTLDVSVDGITLNWDNGAGTTNVEVWFGRAGNVTQVYSGTPITSWSTGALDYFTNYYWRIVDGNDTCGTSTPGWTFKTEQNPVFHDENFYPMSLQYWTGSAYGNIKTDGEINTVYPNVGWAVFDISSIPANAVIDSITFHGYVNATNFPFWSATPMGAVNPVADTAAAIRNQILAGYGQNVAYIYEDKSSFFTTGWYEYPMENNAVPDLEDAVSSGQGWFAMGFVDRDFTSADYINFDGWSQPNPPYLEIVYISSIPVELTSLTAYADEGKVLLNWETETETNNKGFEVERSQSVRTPSEISDVRGKTAWEEIGFVTGNGTSTQTHSYSFTDKNVIPGKYSYRLKQIDFDGTSNYSKEVEIDVNVPSAFALQQNYPNPFNPGTMIQYSIPADEHVKLYIYNLLGQKVVTLIDEFQKAGQHKIKFNALSGNRALASGVYFYNLEAGSQIQIKKMILMK